MSATPDAPVSPPDAEASAGAPLWLSEAEQLHWRAYLRGSRELTQALDKDLQDQGISLSEYELVSMLSEAPGMQMRMSTLADLVVQSRSRVTHTASRLEKKGWVKRTTTPEDGRGVLLLLTAKGRRAVERFAEVHVSSVRQHLVDVLSPEEFAAMGAAMGKVRAAMGTGILEPGERAEVDE